MSETYTSNDILNAIAVAARTLGERKDEVNRLNVFPVPDGDTGTNMSLTVKMVVDNLAKLPIGSSNADVRKAITTGALMGARGNSGVITSQILRGLCEGAADATEFSVASIDKAFDQAVTTAFQAVRKPVEGTILTVIRESRILSVKYLLPFPVFDRINIIIIISHMSFTVIQQISLFHICEI